MKPCKECKKETPSWDHVRNKPRTFCSKKCALEWRRRHNTWAWSQIKKVDTTTHHVP